MEKGKPAGMGCWLVSVAMAFITLFLTGAGVLQAYVQHDKPLFRSTQGAQI